MASLSFQGQASQSGLDSFHTVPITVGSAVGQERLIGLASISQNVATQTYTTVEIDGQPATQVGPIVREQELTSTTSGAIVSFWKAPGTINTNINVFVQTANQVYSVCVALWNLSDDAGLADTAGSNADDPVLDIDTQAGGCVAAVALGYAFPSVGSNMSTWTGLTERVDDVNLFGVDVFTAADANIVGGSTPLPISIAWPAFNNNGGEAQAALAISFIGNAPDIIGTLAATLDACTLIASGSVEAPPAQGIQLSWNPSTDTGGGVAGYKIYRDGVLLGTSLTTGYLDETPLPSVSYSYTVSAYDIAGNESAQSAPLVMQTGIDITPPTVPGAPDVEEI